jgi:hypothetical protein
MPGQGGCRWAAVVQQTQWAGQRRGRAEADRGLGSTRAEREIYIGREGWPWRAHCWDQSGAHPNPMPGRNWVMGQGMAGGIL